MKCDGLRNRYEAYLADELSASLAAEIEEHLSRCGDCRDWYEAQQAIGEALRASAESALPPPPYFDSLFHRVAPRLERVQRLERLKLRILGPLQTFLLSEIPPVRLARATTVCALGLGIGATYGAYLYTPGHGDRPPAVQAASPESAGQPVSGRAVAQPLLSSASLAGDGLQTFSLPNSRDIIDGAAGAIGSWFGYLPSVDSRPPGRTLAALSIAGPPARPAQGLNLSDQPVAAMAQASLGGIPASKFKEYGVFEDLNAIKASLEREGASQLRPVVDRVEKRLGNMADFQDPGVQEYLKQMQLYQTAETALQNRKAMEAEGKYLEVVRVNADTRWACRARYQLGNLEYDIGHDFESAHNYYRKCVKEYPADYLCEYERQRLSERMKLLNESQGAKYEPLKLYSAAKESPSSAAGNLLSLIQRYPSSMLAVRAVLDLTRLATEDNRGDSVNAEEVYREFKTLLAARTAPTLSPYLQMGVADILQYRLEDFPEALAEYSKVVQMTQDAELQARAADQIRRVRWRQGIRAQ